MMVEVVTMVKMEVRVVMEKLEEVVSGSHGINSGSRGISGIGEDCSGYNGRW